MQRTRAEIIERAEQAKYLLGHDLLAEVLEEIRVDALFGLASVDADDKNKILKLQAVAAFTEEFVDKLKTYLIATGEQSGGVSLSNSSKGE